MAIYGSQNPKVKQISLHATASDWPAMVDITAKLIWYRLGETFDKMAEGGNRVTSWLFSDWDDNLLDVLLFGWIGWAVLVVLVVNAVLTFFGPLQPRVARWEKKEGVSGAPVEVETGAESTRWLNSGLNWFYLHYDSVPEFIELWVKSLNEQVVKLGVSFSVTIQSLLCTPNISSIACF